MSFGRFLSLVLILSFVSFPAFGQEAKEKKKGRLLTKGSLDFTSEEDCWAIFFDGLNYRGRHFSVIGPLKIKNLFFQEGKWRDEIDSIMVGPKARVTYYQDESFKGPSHGLLPSSHTGDMGVISNGGNVRSIIVECLKE